MILSVGGMIGVIMSRHASGFVALKRRSWMQGVRPDQMGSHAVRESDSGAGALVAAISSTNSPWTKCAKRRASVSRSAV